MARLLVLFILINIALLAVALIDCLSSERHQIRGLPKPAWVLIILLFPTVGPGMWFAAGRPHAPRGATGSAEGSGPAPAQPAPVGPDDDPEFLRSLSATMRKADEERLRAWEDDLHRREEELRRQQRGGDPPTAGA